MRLSGSGFGFLWGVPLLSGLFTLVTVVILARVGGRLLGIRMRWRRAVLAGIPSLLLGWIAAWSINGQRRGPQTLSWPAVLFSSLIATMLVAVTLELLARPGRLAAVESRLRASPVPHPVRSLRQRAGRTRRYLQVTRIAARHGLSSYLGGRRPGAGESRPLARNIRAALEEAGGMFVKLGQVLSTRADLLPPDVIAELGGQQCLDTDRVNGRDVILEPGQLGDDIGRKQVGPGGQHLAELDEHAAGLVQRGPEVAG